jgi:hypothetical protein
VAISQIRVENATFGKFLTEKFVFGDVMGLLRFWTNLEKRAMQTLYRTIAIVVNSNQSPFSPNFSPIRIF